MDDRDEILATLRAERDDAARRLAALDAAISALEAQESETPKPELSPREHLLRLIDIPNLLTGADVLRELLDEPRTWSVPELLQEAARRGHGDVQGVNSNNFHCILTRSLQPARFGEQPEVVRVGRGRYTASKHRVA